MEAVVKSTVETKIPNPEDLEDEQSNRTKSWARTAKRSAVLLRKRNDFR